MYGIFSFMLEFVKTRASQPQIGNLSSSLSHLSVSDSDRDEMFLCPIRALKSYLSGTVIPCKLLCLFIYLFFIFLLNV